MLASVKGVQFVKNLELERTLLLDSGKLWQLNLIKGWEAAVVQKAAERVASFLGVPLVGAPEPASSRAKPEVDEEVGSWRTC